MNTQDLIALTDKIIASVPIYGDGVESMAYRIRLVQAALAAAQPKGEDVIHSNTPDYSGNPFLKADERGSAEPLPELVVTRDGKVLTDQRRGLQEFMERCEKKEPDRG